MRLSALAAPLVLSTFLALPAAAVLADDGPFISMEGRGEVSAAPDTAFVNSGVTTQGATAREALDANSAAMSRLIETLKAAGIEPRDIQTSGFSVSPNYVYSDQRDANGYQLPPKIMGYSVSNSVTVRVRQLDILGVVLDQSVTVGANTISGVSFAVDDPTALYDEARRRAFASARSKAELYTEAADEELGSIRSIVEGQVYSPPQPYMRRDMAMEAMASAVPVEAGELAFAINVTVTWDLGDD